MGVKREEVNCTVSKALTLDLMFRIDGVNCSDHLWHNPIDEDRGRTQYGLDVHVASSL